MHMLNTLFLLPEVQTLVVCATAESHFRIASLGTSYLFLVSQQIALCVAGVPGLPPGALLLSRVPAGRLGEAQASLQEVLYA